MKHTFLLILLVALAGCIWLQSGTVRNASNATLFVGNPGGIYRKIEPGDVIEASFAYCLEVTDGENSQYYWIPQYHAGSPDLPNDAYQEGRWGPADVKLVYSGDELHFDTESDGHLTIGKSEKDCDEAMRLSIYQKNPSQTHSSTTH